MVSITTSFGNILCFAERFLGFVPIHQAAWIGARQIMTILLSKDPKLNVQTRTPFREPGVSAEKGATALVIATAKQHGDIMELLIRDGADPNVRTVSGKCSIVDISSTQPQL
jgi:ankyrin repeat protein